MTDLLGSGENLFEETKRFDENENEWWSSRDISRILDYSEYRHFEPVIEKAKIACENSGNHIEDHFEDFLDMVQIGSGAIRKVKAVRLSRYACYLIVQNADSSKEIVALGQTYFAIQTRRQELQQMSDEEQRRLMLRMEMRKHNASLADAAYQAGLETKFDFGIFQNHGYKGLYGGMSMKEIHTRKGLKKSQRILDHMGSTELAANLFRATQTEEKLRRDGIQGKSEANKVHYDVGVVVRETIKQLGGTMPEDLPTEDSIKKVERKSQKLIED